MMAHQANLAMTIVVVNNNGGGIFSFLPQAAAKDYFEPMFGTPLALSVEKIAALYDAEYHLATSQDDLRELIAQPATTLRLIEVQSTRAQNVVEHDALLAKIREAFNG